MRKHILLTCFLVMTFALTAQNISVASFRPLETDLTANLQGTSRIDQNGHTCALIKVVTTQTGFTFDVGIMGITDTEQKAGEIWVWVPFGVKHINIGHPTLGFLRDYYFPCSVEEARTYEMVLTTGEVVIHVKETVQQQYLMFQISPHDAVLEVDNQVWNVSAEGTAKKYVNFGTYDYRVQAPNYHSEVGKVTVNDPKNKHVVKVDLDPNFGWIEVSGTGLQGATVYIDNALIGKAPCKSEALKSGQHSVKIAKELYETFTQTVTVTDNETARISPSLTADFANITLAVDADAEIWVNDELKGTRRWTGNLATGTYKIECKMPSHEASLTNKDIDNTMNGQTISLNAPRPIYGALNVDATPDFCDLYIDGKKVGETPMFVSELLIGQHEVKLTKDGYEDYEQTLTISEGQKASVEVKLEKKKEYLTFSVNGVTFKMLPVEGGTFTMGATSEQGSDAYDNEKPTHSVTLSSYYMGETEVTQALWLAVMGSNPSNIEVNNLPMTCVSWNDCQEFITKLNQLCASQLNGRQFALPTEAQWEYAARGGNKSRGYKYSGSNTLDDVAWYTAGITPNSATKPVGTKQANELGLYDMSGNVREWCQDWYGDYGSGAQTDPTGASSGYYRVIRGGSWISYAKDCRVSIRSGRIDSRIDFSIGLRLAL